MDKLNNIIWSPHDTAMAGYESAKNAVEKKGRGIELSIDGTDIHEYFAPVMPWEIVGVQAQTSNGKTYFTNWWERQIAEQLTKNGRNEVIIRVSLEESIEALAFSEYSRELKISTSDLARGQFEDWAKMQMAMTTIDQIPVWRIAESSERVNEDITLHLSNIYRCIQMLMNGDITGEKVQPAVVIIDYLQALPIDDEIKKAPYENQRRLQVMSDIFRIRHMTISLNCPIIVTIQAKQELSSKSSLKIPGMYDAMESAAIAQRCDRLISLWMPKTTDIVGMQIDLPTGGYSVSDNGVFLKINKQRGGLPSGAIYDLKVNYKEQKYTDRFWPTAEARERGIQW